VAWFSGRDSSDDGADDTESISPWESTGFVASAIVIGAVVVCLVVWLVLGGRGGDTPATQPTATPSVVEPTDEPTDEPTEPPATPGDPTATTPPPLHNATGGCKSKAPDQSIPRVAPASVSWQFETDMLIPLQTQGGPASTYANGVRYCFAHSPTGAVLAAMVTLGQIRNPRLTEAVLRTRIAPGAGLTRALREVRTSPTPRGEGDTSQFTGFKVIDYEPTKAIVSIAVQIDPQSVAALPITLRWLKGDWKVVLQPDGSFNGDVAPDVLQSLQGYVRFGGA
jgi:hypothetical protein